MSQLQYIGARYVPKFYENSLDPSSMDWESGLGYEPLTVVTYNSDTYTSKVPVPSTVGAPDANPTYWAKTADYNAALVALQNAVNNIDNNEIPALDTRIDRAITGELKNSDRKLLIITDSYGLFLSPETDNFPYRLLEYLNCSGKVVAESGSGFVGNGLADTFQTLFENEPIDDYTDILFVGGYNDYNTWFGTVRDSAINAIVAVNTAYTGKNINIWLIMCGASMDSDLNWRLINVVQAYRDAAHFTNTRFANLSSVLMKRELLALDGVHPGQEGMALLGMEISQLMQHQFTGSNRRFETSNMTDANGTTIADLVNNGENNGIAAMHIGKFDCSLATPISPVTCDGNTSHEIVVGTLVNPIIQGGRFNCINGNLYVRGKQTSGSSTVFWNLTGYYYLHDNELRFVPMRLSEGYSSWFSLYEIDYYCVPPLAFYAPPYLQ